MRTCWLLGVLIILLPASCDNPYEDVGSINAEAYPLDDGGDEDPDPRAAEGNVLELAHPDAIDCDDRNRLIGGPRDTVGDLSSEEGILPYLYYVRKYLFPLLGADCQIEQFFQGQDLSFENEWEKDAEEVSAIGLSAVGDLMVHTRLTADNSVHLYDDIHDELFNADIVFGNLETPAHPGRASAPFPSFNLSAEATRVYLGVDEGHGFDVVSTANNHVLDQGEEGLRATLDYLDKLNVLHVGSSRTREERDEEFPIIEKNGIKTALLAYTFSTNGRPLPQGREYEVNLVQLNTLEGPPDISMIEQHLATARDLGADFVVVSLHWSMEYEFYPPRRIIELGHRIADAGADVILGHHPHMLNPLESYVPQSREEGVPEVLIAYSLGNFIPGQWRTVFRTSIILHVELSRGVIDGETRVWISGVDYTPVWWYARAIPGQRDYRLINLNRALADREAYSFLSGRDWRMLHLARDLIIERF